MIAFDWRRFDLVHIYFTYNYMVCTSQYTKSNTIMSFLYTGFYATPKQTLQDLRDYLKFWKKRVELVINKLSAPNLEESMSIFWKRKELLAFILSRDTGMHAVQGRVPAHAITFPSPSYSPVGMSAVPESQSVIGHPGGKTHSLPQWECKRIDAQFIMWLFHFPNIQLNRKQHVTIKWTMSLQKYKMRHSLLMH